MYEYLIKEYVKTANTDDIKKYCLTNNIPIKDEDAVILLKYLKKDWKLFYDGDPSLKIKELENKIDPITFKLLKEKYIQIKDKIKK